MPDVLHSLLLAVATFLLGSVPGRPAWRRAPATVAAERSPQGHWRQRVGALAFGLAKGGIAAWVGLRFAPAVATYASPTAHAYAAALLAALGHSLPVWKRSTGASPLVPLAGAVLVLWPWVVPVLLAVWGGTLLAVGSPVLAAALAAVALVGAAWWSGATPPRFVFAAAAAAMVLAADRGALWRMARGEGPRFAAARLLLRLRRGPR